MDIQLIIFIIIAVILSLVLSIISYILSIRNQDIEKLSPYECGFEPYGDARAKFDIRFYIVSLIFILFDLEISYLFPFIFFLQSGYIIFTTFILVLTIGFIFEFQFGVLDSL